MKNYLDQIICKKCKGLCCKQLPGACLPEDFQPLESELKKAFKSGKYAVDWWEGNPHDNNKTYKGTFFYIRPSIKGDNLVYNPSWGGECIMLSINGCELNPDKRPAGCRMLEPNKTFKCRSHGADKKEAAIAWEPYHNLITKIFKKEYPKEVIKCS